MRRDTVPSAAFSTHVIPDPRCRAAAVRGPSLARVRGLADELGEVTRLHHAGQAAAALERLARQTRAPEPGSAATRAASVV